MAIDSIELLAGKGVHSAKVTRVITVRSINKYI